jgi:hypothetical protein
MNYTAEMGTGAMIHIQSFTETGSGIQELLGRNIDIQARRRSHKPKFIFSKYEKIVKLSL